MATDAIADLAPERASGSAESVGTPRRLPAVGFRSHAWMGRRGLLLALLALAFVRGVIYTFLIPPWQHPDEPGHFEHARLIAEEHRLPGIVYVSYDTRREIGMSMREFDFWEIAGRTDSQPYLDDRTLDDGSPVGIPALSQPRLYYLIGAVWLQPWLPFSVEAQMYALRLLGVLMNLGIVALVWRAASVLLPSEPHVRLAACGLVVFEPMFTDLMAAVNNDTLANLLAAVYFVALAQMFRQGIRWRSALVAAVAIVLGVQSKTTFIAVVATLPFVALFYPWRRRWVRVGVWVVAAIGVAAVSAFVWLSLQGAGGVVGQLVGRAQRYFRIYWVDSVRSVLGVDRQGPDLGTTVSVVFRSFWAYFGWRAIAMPDAYYYLPLGLTGLGLVGVGAAVVRRLRGGNGNGNGGRAGYLSLSFASVAVIWAVAILRSQIVQGVTTYSHGRYAFVGMVPFALLMAWGILGLVPARWRSWAAVGLVAAVAVFDGACLGVAVGWTIGR